MGAETIVKNNVLTCSEKVATAVEKTKACTDFKTSIDTAKKAVTVSGVTYPLGVCTPINESQCVTFASAFDTAKSVAEKVPGVTIDKNGLCVGGGSFALKLSVLFCFLYSLLK